MGLLIDTGVSIEWERLAGAVDLSALQGFGQARMSVVTASELLVGVERAKEHNRRQQRARFVSALLANVAVIPVSLDVARVHATVFASLQQAGSMIGAHDLWIAATALHLGDTLLTSDRDDFRRVPGLALLDSSSLGN